jgi:hypothetical protein
MTLHLNTVSDLLWNSLTQLMGLEEFDPFRLVGKKICKLGHLDTPPVLSQLVIIIPRQILL